VENLLATKLYIPVTRRELVPRPRLIEQLNGCLCQNQGFSRKLTLISAPAGFGKTTLVMAWVDSLRDETPKGKHTEYRIAWLSLDEGDNAPTCFLTYFITAIKQIKGSDARFGERALAMLQSPEPQPVENILTLLINEIATIPNKLIFILDDYHLIDAQPIHIALTFLLKHLPPQIHLVIITREDPLLPLSRLRARGQLTELRASDLRFITAEAGDFLNQVMGLGLSTKEIVALEKRTEGWIVGLQMAALALQGLSLQKQISTQGLADITNFIQDFTGSHHYVLDYLVEEVLQQQPESIQAFLLRTSILNRMCGPLCDAVCFDEGDKEKNSLETTHCDEDVDMRLIPSATGQEILEYIQQANLFIVPLDNERRWFRYHHLFAELLRQRLLQKGDEDVDITKLHTRASIWYEHNALEIEAFYHATAANDVERAALLMEGNGMPLHFRGAITPVLNWLSSLPKSVLDARPSLWVMYASALSMTGQTTGVEEKLQAAEAAIAKTAAVRTSPQAAALNENTRNLIGHIAAIRALLAATQYQVDTIISESIRALEFLHPDNLAVRTATIWKMGIAYQIQGDRAAASQAYSEAISISQASGNNIINISATTGLGSVQESDNQLYLAAQTYRRVLQLVGDSAQPSASEAYLGLARIHYQWNDLELAQQHAQQSIQLAQPMENTDRIVPYKVFLARLKLAQGDAASAASILAQVDQFVYQHNFSHRMPEVAATQVLTLLKQSEQLYKRNLEAALDLAMKYRLPISQARVLLAQGNTSAALAILEPFRQQMEAKGWVDKLLKVMVLQAVTLRAHLEKDKALHVLNEALALAKPGGLVRIFVDEGFPMAHLLSEEVLQGAMSDHAHKLLAVFEAEERKRKDKPDLSQAHTLIDPLSQRELEILQLIAQGLSNREISERLFLALSTVKGHNRNIFSKLQVQRRTEAIARARELGLL